MKRSLLSLLVFGGTTLAMGQCIPNQLYADSVFGVWPDTTENFLPGVVNEAYSDTLYVLIPANAGDVDPQYEGLTVDSVVFNGITGLPEGIEVQCNSQTPAPCTFLPTQVGCGLLTGIPTVAGTYDLDVTVTGYTTVLGFPFSVPLTFSGYTIVVDAGGMNVASVMPVSLGKVQTVPNPFATRTNIEFTLNRGAATRVQVFNLVGEELWKETIEGKAGPNRVPFDAGRMDSGIYLYKVSSGNQTFTGRMVVNR
jgi:hypothetical protein